MLKFGILAILITLTCAKLSFADNITLGTSNAPPYMIKESNSGIDIEIAKTVLEKLGHRVTIKYFSLDRAKIELEEKKIDAMVPLFSSAGSEKVYVSNPHVLYRPTAFSLKGKKLEVNTLQDLKKYRLMTFQGAKGYFGPEFKEVANQAKSYKEHFDMTKLVMLLYRQRTDIVLLDYNIFHYYLKDINFTKKLEILKTHQILPKVPAVVGFNNKKLRDQFNEELKKLYDDGTQRSIINKYIK